MAGTKSHVLSVFMSREYPAIVRGEGVYLYEESGKRYIDAAGGCILVNLGHGNKEMAETLKQQAEKVAFAYRLDFTTPILEQAADGVCRVSNNDFDKVFFVSGGSEATEISVKLARKFHIDNKEPGRYKVISRWQSYHGSTNGALSWSGHTFRRADFQPYLRDFAHIAPAYCYRCWFNQSPERCNLECAQALENEILCQGPDTVSAFIIEPLSGSSLCAAYPRDDYFTRVREICDKYGVLLILDEVMTGFGRTGKYFAYQHFGIVPDIIALGKGLGGGYFPIGAAACSARISDTIAQNSGIFGTGHSWAGNPVGAAVVVKTMEILERDGLIERSHEMGEYLAQRLEDLRRHPTVGDIRGKGLMRGVEFVKDKDTREALDPGAMFWLQLSHECISRGEIMEVSFGNDRGQRGDLCMFGPPFISSREEIDEMVDILDQAVTAVEKNLGF
jgi:adenosylmethionine-8-amino-7-oxononanoate aminotransferase